MRFSLKTIFGIFGILFIIIYCIHGVKINEVLKILKEMNKLHTLVAFGLTILNLFIRATVFKLVVNPIKKIPIKQALYSYLVGVFSNLFLPFKLGDIAQGVFLGKNNEISKVSAVSAVFIQRFFEITTLMVIMMITAFVFSFPLLFKEKSFIIGISIIIVIVLMFIAFNKKNFIAQSIQNIFKNFSPKIAESASRNVQLFLQGTSAMHNLPGVTQIIILSTLSWIVQIIMVKYTTEALNISINLVESCVVLLIINIGLTIPLAPGNIGTFQFFGTLALSLFSIDKNQALLFSIIFQVIQGIPVIIGGGAILMNEVLHKRRATV